MSRMMREFQVRFCEGLGVQIPGLLDSSYSFMEPRRMPKLCERKLPICYARSLVTGRPNPV